MMGKSFPLVFANGYPADINTLNELRLECFLKYLWSHMGIPKPARILPSENLKKEERILLLKKAIENCYRKAGRTYLINMSKGLSELDKTSINFEFSEDGKIVSLWNKTFSQRFAKIPENNLSYDTGLFTAEINSVHEKTPVRKKSEIHVLDEINRLKKMRRKERRRLNSNEDGFPVISEVVSLSCPEQFVRFMPPEKLALKVKNRVPSPNFKMVAIPAPMHFSIKENVKSHETTRIPNLDSMDITKRNKLNLNISVDDLIKKKVVHSLVNGMISEPAMKSAEESIILSDSDSDYEREKVLPQQELRISPKKMLILSDVKKVIRSPPKILFPKCVAPTMKESQFLSKICQGNQSIGQPYAILPASCKNDNMNDKQTIVLSDSDSDHDDSQKKPFVPNRQLLTASMKKKVIPQPKTSFKKLMEKNDITITKLHQKPNDEKALDSPANQSILLSDSDSENSPNLCYTSNANTPLSSVKGYYLFKRRRIHPLKPRLKEVSKMETPVEEIEISDADEVIDEKQKKIDFCLRLGLCEPSNLPDDPIILPNIDEKSRIFDKFHQMPLHMVPFLVTQGLIHESAMSPGPPGQNTPEVTRSSWPREDRRRSWRMPRSVGSRLRLLDYEKARDYKFPKKTFRTSLPVPLPRQKVKPGPLCKKKKFKVSCSSNYYKRLYEQWKLKCCQVVLHKLSPDLLSNQI